MYLTGSLGERPPGTEAPNNLAFTISLISPVRGPSWVNVWSVTRSGYLQPLNVTAL